MQVTTWNFRSAFRRSCFRDIAIGNESDTTRPDLNAVRRYCCDMSGGRTATRSASKGSLDNCGDSELLPGNQADPALTAYAGDGSVGAEGEGEMLTE